MKSYTVFEAVGGSHAAGLATETSDVDKYKVVVYEPAFYLGAVNYSGRTEQVFGKMDELKGDDTTYELRHFMGQCLKGNPTALRLLWSPKYEVFNGRVAAPLLAGRHLFLTKALYKPFRGAAVGYMGRAMSAGVSGWPNGTKAKEASNALQLLWQLDEALWLDNLPVRLLDNTVKWLRDVRAGYVTWGEVLDQYHNMLAVVEKSVVACKLPEQPDLDAVNELTANLVYEAWSEMGVHPGGF